MKIFFFVLHVLYFIQSPAVDIQLAHQRFAERSDDLGMFAFPFFAIFANRLSSILFTCSSLDLAHLMAS
jgi:hypothetical protein